MAAGRGSWRVLRWAGVAVLAASLAAAAALPAFVGWWLDSSDEPRPADMILVLCGQEYSRAVYAADLFLKGYAPEVWLARVQGRRDVALARELGVKALDEDEVFEAILLRKGVPRKSIRRFGSGVVSTVGEVAAFRAAAARSDLSVLAVTSRYHARRARLVLRRALPGCSVTVAADPAGPAVRPWWSDQDAAKNGILETAKLAYFLLGGSFGSEAAGTKN
ncbi:MAG: YdcF family protein [Elusimicrobia bacterium]|nr:YdcF family protein [Elusimicrobiota bacterium]